jgi:hypothetical protein
MGLDSSAIQSVMRSPAPTPPPVFIPSHAGGVSGTLDASIDLSSNDALMLLTLQQQAAEAPVPVSFEHAGPALPVATYPKSEQDIDEEVHYLLALKQQLQQKQQQQRQQQQQDQLLLAAAGMAELLSVEQSGASYSR